MQGPAGSQLAAGANFGHNVQESLPQRSVLHEAHGAAAALQLVAGPVDVSHAHNLDARGRAVLLGQHAPGDCHVCSGVGGSAASLEASRCVGDGPLAVVLQSQHTKCVSAYPRLHDCGFAETHISWQMGC